MLKFLLFLTPILLDTSHSMMMSDEPNRVRRNSTISASVRVPSTAAWSFTGEGMKRNASTGTERVQRRPNGAKKSTIKQIPNQPLSPFYRYTSTNIKSQPNSPMLNAPRVTNFDGCRPENMGFRHLLFRSKSTADRKKNAEWLKKCNTYPPSNSKKVAASSSKEKQNNEKSEKKQNKTDKKQSKDKNLPNGFDKLLSILMLTNKNEIPKPEAEPKVKSGSKRLQELFNQAEQREANKTIYKEVEDKSFAFPLSAATTPMMTPSRMWGRSDSSGQEPELVVLPLVEQNGQDENLI